MVQPNQLEGTSLKADRLSLPRFKGHRTTIEQTIREIPDGAATVGRVVSTARIIISAEEKLRGRLRSGIRVAVATTFLGISGLISLGANVTMAFAKKVSPETTRVKRTKNHLKVKFYRHSGRLYDRVKSHHTSLTLGHEANHLHGIASWYGGKFNHRKTASGNRFNTRAMTAAHRTLPFGTKVCVTNLQNHKSCVVEITDRGPYAYNRVIDLSYAAAERLDMTYAGTAEVKLEVLGTQSLFQDIASASSDGEDLAPSKEGPVFDRIPSFPSRTLDSMLNAPASTLMLAEQDADR